MSELTAALATIEKCREITNCPAGVDLQDHLRQLAAENVGLKAAINAVNRTAEECEVNGDELKYVVEPSEFEALIDFLDETPATDRILAVTEARGVEKFALSRRELAKETTSKIMPLALEAEAQRADDFAKQLREGAR